jgi:probable selenium-dependent hydroxylase accessory protein YqeC
MSSAGFSFCETSDLAAALTLNPGDVVSLVGGGGKTSLMYRLAAELAAGGSRVVSTTTTRILPPEPGQSACVIVEEDEDTLIALAREALSGNPHITLARFKPGDEKLKGLLPETVDSLHKLKLADYILNEADGASRQPLKAPNPTEPVIPLSTSLVVALVGIEALGKPLSPETAFRISFITQLTGLKEGETITSAAVATLLTHARGIIQHTPASARIVTFVNKVENPGQESAARALAEEILARGHPQIGRVVFGAVKKPGKPISVVTRKFQNSNF